MAGGAVFAWPSPAVENFKALCTGEKGMSKNCGVRYHYKDVNFHRVVKGFMMQAGAYTRSLLSST